MHNRFLEILNTKIDVQLYTPHTVLLDEYFIISRTPNHPQDTIYTEFLADRVDVRFTCELC